MGSVGNKLCGLLVSNTILNTGLGMSKEIVAPTGGYSHPPVRTSPLQRVVN